MLVKNIRLEKNPSELRALYVSPTEFKVLENTSSVDAIDAKGAYLYPGLVDSHVHFLYHHLYQKLLKIEGPASIDGLKKISNFYPGWLVAFGWKSLDELPSFEDLEQNFSDVFWYLSRVDGHQVLTNEKTFNLIKHHIKPSHVSRESLAYLLAEEAAEELRHHIPKLSAQQISYLYQESEKDFFAHGIVEVHDSGDEFSHLQILRTMYEKREMKIIYSGSYSAADLSQALEPIQSLDKRFGLFSVKLFLDGSLGSRTAATSGREDLLLKSDGEVIAFINEIQRKGLSPKFHAIGIEAVKQAIRCIEQVGGIRFPRPARIEHAEFISQSLLRTCKNLGIELALQPCHLIEDVKTIKEFYPNEKNLMPLKTMLEAQVKFSFGSDTPIEKINPRRNLWAALHLAAPEQRLSFSEALIHHLSQSKMNEGTFFLSKEALSDLKEPNSVPETSNLSRFTCLKGEVVYSEL